MIWSTFCSLVHFSVYYMIKKLCVKILCDCYIRGILALCFLPMVFRVAEKLVENLGRILGKHPDFCNNLQSWKNVLNDGD